MNYVPPAGAALRSLPGCLLSAGNRPLWQTAIVVFRTRSATPSKGRGGRRSTSHGQAPDCCALSRGAWCTRQADQKIDSLLSTIRAWRRPTSAPTRRFYGREADANMTSRLHPCHLGGRSGHAENDPSTLPWLANHFHLPAVKQHDALHDRQPKARAAGGL